MVFNIDAVYLVNLGLFIVLWLVTKLSNIKIQMLRQVLKYKNDKIYFGTFFFNKGLNG
jgi:hypothetical protein